MNVAATDIHGCSLPNCTRWTAFCIEHYIWGLVACCPRCAQQQSAQLFDHDGLSVTYRAAKQRLAELADQP